LKTIQIVYIVVSLRELPASGLPAPAPLLLFLHSRTTKSTTNPKRKQEIGTMENKPAQNIQDTFLNTVRKDKTPITIYLVSGVKLTGKIRSFDKYSVLLENNSQEQLIFKHAISTVVSSRGVIHGEHRPPGVQTSLGAAPASVPAAAPVAASGAVVVGS
jgi:host factor-I protein